METIQSLIEVLTSLCKLYEDLVDVIQQEKQYIVSWKVDKTVELTKKKDTILYKERLLEEARRTIHKKIAQQMGVNDPKLSDIIAHIGSCPEADALNELRTRLEDLSGAMRTDTTQLKILYSSNMRLVNDFMQALGLQPAKIYNDKHRAKKAPVSTFVQQG